MSRTVPASCLNLFGNGLTDLSFYVTLSKLELTPGSFQPLLSNLGPYRMYRKVSCMPVASAVRFSGAGSGESRVIIPDLIGGCF